MTDYIDREAFKAEIRRLSTHYLNEWDTLGVLAAADRIPAADVRPVVRGRWEEVEVTWLADIEDQPDAIASMFCPECKRFANHVYHYGDPTHGMDYCPNCGARMEEQE